MALMLWDRSDRPLSYLPHTDKGRFALAVSVPPASAAAGYVADGIGNVTLFAGGVGMTRNAEEYRGRKGKREVHWDRCW